MSAPTAAVAAPSPGPTPVAAPTADPGVSGEAVFVSDEDLARITGDPYLDMGSGPGRATTPAEVLARAQEIASKRGGLDIAPSDITPMIAEPQWYTSACPTITDWDGNRIRTRYGDYSNFGYRKIVAVHGITSCDPITSGYNGYVDGKSGSNWTYLGLAVVNGYPRMTIVTVASTSRTSRYGATPDGAWVGTITSYCQGYSGLCPDWIP